MKQETEEQISSKMLNAKPELWEVIKSVEGMQ
jgi:hypothetical protein